MLFFDRLTILSEHLTFLQQKIKKADLFCVGGCVRDVLLGLTTSPDDIDITSAGNPEEIWENADKTDMSCFITEKFGTMTFIPKTGTRNEGQGTRDGEYTATPGQGGTSIHRGGGLSTPTCIKYELTPFRTEGTYTDKRRPDTIQRSNSLIADAQRREFTISCLYYTCSGGPVPPCNNTTKTADPESLLSDLEKQGFSFISPQNVLIIQSHTIIESLRPNGIFNEEEFAVFCKKNNLTIHLHETVCHFLVDPSQGIQDMWKGKLRAVGIPDKRFGEDALRILRAIRFITVLNTKLTRHYFDIEKETRTSLQKNFYLVRTLPKERINQEVLKVFRQGSPFHFLSLCDSLNLLKDFFPSLHATKNIVQPVRYHPFDVFVHTLLCVREIEKMTTNPLVRMAMVFHDVGKVDQYYLYGLGLDKEQTNEIGPLNHRNSSSMIARPDLARLGFGNKDIEEICWYIDNHHKPEEILSAKPENQIKKLRKIYAEAGYEKTCNLFILTKADRQGQYNPIQALRQSIGEIDYLQTLLDELRDKEGQFTMQQLAVDGTWVMKNFSLDPSPRVGELLHEIYDWVAENIEGRNNKSIILERFREK